MSLLMQLSADSREDVVSVVALPIGAAYRLRYSEESVSPQVRSLVDSDQIAGNQVVLAFVSGIGGGKPFFLPIRHAEVKSAERLGPLFVVEIQLAGFADLMPWPDSLSTLIQASREVIGQLTMNRGAGHYPVTAVFPTMPGEVTHDLQRGWYEVVRRLTTHPDLGTIYLLCIDSIETTDGAPSELDPDGRVQVVEGTSIRIIATYYSAASPADEGIELTCATGADLSVVSGAAQKVDRRHDAVEIVIQVGARPVKSLSTVTISVGCFGNPSVLPAAIVTAPVRIVRSKLRRVLSWGLWTIGSAVGTLINLPEVGLSWPFKVAATVAGMAVGVLSREVARPGGSASGTPDR